MEKNKGPLFLGSQRDRTEALESDALQRMWRASAGQICFVFGTFRFKNRGAETDYLDLN
jgi:hypothetical protein